jgi:hypothetical protein
MLFTKGRAIKKLGTDYKLTSQPFIIEKMTICTKQNRIHCSFLNIFFGLSLFFFCDFFLLDVSAQTTIFKGNVLYRWWVY